MYPRVLYTLSRTSGTDLGSSEDLTQGAIERFLRYGGLDRVKTDGEAVAYLVQTARRLASDLGRKRSPRLHVLRTGDWPDEEGEGGEVDVDALDLERLVARLSEDDGRLIRALLAGRTISDIAQDLSIGYTAAATRVHRARRRLRELAWGV